MKLTSSLFTGRGLGTIKAGFSTITGLIVNNSFTLLQEDNVNNTIRRPGKINLFIL